ncbi:M1 family metallopeptidase [Robertkochia aurantiaca]|uniref:M1 family metallopeptidase n=1 Tax=Robertkochia aurantiaca TaxID=2873700 RepID=UPI001CCAAC85|nr:M1 family metallopeptidase [Robertkochia sp. 3YJGBD-33]
MKHILGALCLILYFQLNSQSVPVPDVQNGRASITVIPDSSLVRGEVEYLIDNAAQTDSFYIDARNMTIKKVLVDNKVVPFIYDSLRISVPVEKTQKETKVSVWYETQPEKAMYFINWKDDKHQAVFDYPPVRGGAQVWTQGQGKYSSHWIPSFDNMSEKLIFDLSVMFPADYTVVANGTLKKVQKEGGQRAWHYDMDLPMSSYLLAIAAGKYRKSETRSDSGIPLMNYYYPEDSLRVEPTYRYTKTIFNFLEKEIGVPFPWQNYKQVPVKDFLYAGMENTSLTIFSDMYVTDSVAFNDQNYINVNAHEMAHQWFGNLVTETDAAQHWLHEGFATYYAWLAERRIFGEDHYYWKLLEATGRLQRLSDQGEGESLTDPKASSLTFYEKGAIALHMLRERLGDDAFKAAVRSFLNKFSYRNATVDDFLRIAEGTSGARLQDFQQRWLTDSVFPVEEVMTSLIANDFVKAYKQVQQEAESVRKGSAPEQTARIAASWKTKLRDDSLYHPVKQLIVSSAGILPQVQQKDLLETALKGGLYTRQAIALSLNEVPQDLRKPFESLLTDASYLTIEQALLKLWISFPEFRETYLEQTAGVFGFNSANIRTLWLALSLVTEGVGEKEKEKRYADLVHYTDDRYHFMIRQNAYGYLKELSAFDKSSVRSLIRATRHPVWQFSRFSRDMLRDLMEQDEFRFFLQQFRDELSTDELQALNEVLNKDSQ